MRDRKRQKSLTPSSAGPLSPDGHATDTQPLLLNAADIFKSVSHHRRVRLGIRLVLRLVVHSDLRETDTKPILKEILHVSGETPTPIAITRFRAVSLDLLTD